VLISQKGFKVSSYVTGNNYSFTQTTDFLDIPILVQLKPSPFLTILAGPEYSCLMHSKYAFASSTISSSQEAEIKNQNIRKNTLGLEFGLDFNKKINFVLSGRLAWDLQNMNGGGTSTSTSTSTRYANSWAQLTVGYKIYSI
jgi:hypothetical protein